MADKRMFNRKVIESDAFMDLNAQSQNLYFHLSMNADDDGFLDNVSGVMAQTKADRKDLDTLIANGFILHASKYIYVIAHWFINNNLQKDRFHPTIYGYEKSLLVRPNNIWAFAEGVSQYTEISIDQNSKGKNRKDKEKHCYGEYGNVLLTDDEYKKLCDEYPDADARIDNLSGAIKQHGYSYASHYATIRNWARKEEKQQPKAAPLFDIEDGLDGIEWEGMDE